MSLTPNQLSILQHSLGLDEYGQGSQYRNYYAVDPDADDPDCIALEKMGLMRSHPLSLPGCKYYSVTEAGMKAVRDLSPTPPKLTRAQQRYRRWLNADCGLSFGEWLKYAEVTR